MENIKKVRDEIEAILKTSSFYSKLKLVEETTMFSNKIDQEISVKGRIGSAYKNELATVSSKIADYLKTKYGNTEGPKKMQSVWKVTSGLCEGDTFTSYEASTLQGQKVKVEHKKGNILLVDVWATWCGYCHEPMQDNVNIMAKNTNFASENVSIIGISCDEDFAKWKSFVATKKWHTIPQYNNKDVMSFVGVRGIPYIFILDKEGVVVYQGHPGHCDVENSLKNLIAGKNIIKRGGESGEEKDQNPFWNDLDVDTKKTFVSECQNIVKNNGLNEVQFLVNTAVTKDLSTGKETVTNTPILYGYVKQTQEDAIDIVFTEISSTYNFNGIAPNLRLKQ
jgi:thiol-disulfide isomerase/thioredoxin